MASLSAATTVLSCFTIRLAAYIFFRWIPGHQLPPLIYAAAVIYVTSFIISYRTTVGDEASENGVVKRTSEGGIHRQRNSGSQASGERARPQRERDLQVTKCLIWGLPRSKSRLWSIVTFLINILLVLGVVDAVYRGPMLYHGDELSFTRLGFVSDTTAKILVREPDLSQLPIFVSYRAVPGNGMDDSWKSVETIHLLSNDTDYTRTVTIEQLQPRSVYQYAVSNNHSGQFKTGPPAGETDPESNKFAFFTSSCIKAQFPYNPLAHPLSIPGLRHLAKLIRTIHPSFMLFLGDFIYVDVPLRFGADTETYRREYRRVYSSPDWPAASRSLPWLHVIDDHEIANDWDKGTTPPYPAAIDPWEIYHASPNPPPAHANASYFQFTQGPASFFMLDTRRYRSPERALHASSPHKTMLGGPQLSSLLSFLAEDEPPGVKWKFVISSVPFTSNWRVNADDTWAGYLHERRIVLEAMWDVGLRGIGVVVLSGDRHEFAATAFPPPPKESRWPESTTVHEFSTSPLSMFYLPLRSYWEVEGGGPGGEREICVKYWPDGNSKFGAVELEAVSGGEQGLLRFRLVVDGEEVWEHVLLTPPGFGNGSVGGGIY